MRCTGQLPTLVVYSTIDARVLYNSPFGNVAPDPPVAIFQRFLEFAEGGLTAPWEDTDLQLAARIEAMLETPAKLNVVID